MANDPTGYEDEEDMADKRKEITKIKIGEDEAFLNLDSQIAVTVNTLKTTGNITQVGRTLDDTYVRKDEETASVDEQTLDVSLATFTGTSHIHTTAETPHVHTYSKVTGVTIRSSGTSGSSKARLSCALTKNGVVTLTDHSHTYDKATEATFNGSKVTSENATTGITAELETAPTFSPNAHSHTVTDKQHSHTYTPAGTNTVTTSSIDTDNTTTTVNAKFTKDPYVEACGTHVHELNYGSPCFSATVTNGVMSFALTPGSVSMTEASASNIYLQGKDIEATSTPHSHKYDKTMEVTFTGTQGNTSSSATGISIVETSAGGTINKPLITVTDNGHTHGLKAAGTITLTYQSQPSGCAKSGAKFADPEYTVTDSGHTHTLTINSKAVEGDITYCNGAESGQASTGLTINEETATGTISNQTVTIPSHSHKQQ